MHYLSKSIHHLNIIDELSSHCAGGLKQNEHIKTKRQTSRHASPSLNWIQLLHWPHRLNTRPITRTWRKNNEI